MNVLSPMTTMSKAIRRAIEDGSGVTKISEIPDDHLEAYADIVTAFSMDLRAEVERRLQTIRLGK